MFEDLLDSYSELRWVVDLEAVVKDTSGGFACRRRIGVEEGLAAYSPVQCVIPIFTAAGLKMKLGMCKSICNTARF